MPDQRSQARVSLPTIGQLDLGDRVVPCILLDLSEGGLALLTAANEYPLGAVQVRFRLGGLDAGRASIDAEVVNRNDDKCGMSSRWSLRSLPMDLGTRTRVRDLVLSSARAVGPS